MLGVLVDEVAKLAVRRRRQRRLIRIPNGYASVRADTSIAVRRGHRDDDQFLGARIVDSVALAGRDERTCIGLELVLAVEQEFPAAGDDEEDFLPTVVLAFGRPALREADHALLEVLAAA